LELLDKVFQAVQEYASTMTPKIHTTVVAVAVLVDLDGQVKTRINNRPHMADQELPVIF
jgi:hypothetical protein